MAEWMFLFFSCVRFPGAPYLYLWRRPGRMADDATTGRRTVSGLDCESAFGVVSPLILIPLGCDRIVIRRNITKNRHDYRLCASMKSMFLLAISLHVNSEYGKSSIAALACRSSSP